jgi:hypothetical protein
MGHILAVLANGAFSKPCLFGSKASVRQEEGSLQVFIQLCGTG